MTAFLVVLHIIVCIALICIVLLQTGKGASLGAAFGGSTQTVFGATGSAGFLGKITTAVAILFMITSLSLTYLSAKRGGGTIMQETQAQEEKAPAADSPDAWPQAAAPEQAPPAQATASETAAPAAAPEAAGRAGQDADGDQEPDPRPGGPAPGRGAAQA